MFLTKICVVGSVSGEADLDDTEEMEEMLLERMMAVCVRFGCGSDVRRALMTMR